MFQREAAIIKRYFQCQVPVAIASQQSSTFECDRWTAYINVESDRVYLSVVNAKTFDEVYGPVPHTEYREWDIDALTSTDTTRPCEACAENEPNPACLNTPFCVECYPFVVSLDEECLECGEKTRGVWLKMESGEVYHRKCFKRMENQPDGDYAII